MYTISSRQEATALADVCLAKPSKQFALKIEGDHNLYRVGADSEGMFKIDLQEHTTEGPSWKSLKTEAEKDAFVERLCGKLGKRLPAEPMTMASDDDYAPLVPAAKTTAKKSKAK